MLCVKRQVLRETWSDAEAEILKVFTYDSFSEILPYISPSSLIRNGSVKDVSGPKISTTHQSCQIYPAKH